MKVSQNLGSGEKNPRVAPWVRVAPWMRVAPWVRVGHVKTLMLRYDHVPASKQLPDLAAPDAPLSAFVSPLLA